MGSAGVSKVCLHILNVFYALFSLALAAGSIWLFVQVKEFTSLRNSNHYLLDYKVYWPQAIPWLFFVAAIFAFCVTLCGFAGASKKSRGVIIMYISCMTIAIVVLVAVAIVALIFADNKSTDDFVKDTVWDAYFQSKTDDEVATSFGNIEKKLHCCGADSPRDYKNWKAEFPTSCCDVYYHGWLEPYAIDCQFTNKLANERHGCSTVATEYARIAIKVLSAVSIFTAFLGIISLVVATALSRALKKKSQIIATQHEYESKKGLI